VQVADADAIAQIVQHLWRREPERHALLAAAADVTSRGGASLERTLHALEALLPARAHAAA